MASSNRMLFPKAVQQLGGVVEDAAILLSRAR